MILGMLMKRFRESSLHLRITQRFFVRIPMNLIQKLRRYREVELQRSEASSEALNLRRLPRGSRVQIIYNLEAESPNLGELTVSLLFARYLARYGFHVSFVLVAPNLSKLPNTIAKRYESNLLAQMHSLGRELADGCFEFKEAPSRSNVKDLVDWSSHVLFGEFILNRTPILTHIHLLFGIRELVHDFGDPKTLVQWTPSGYVGWHIRESTIDSARNYGSNRLLLEDAVALTKAFPSLKIRIFTTESGRSRITQACSEIVGLRRLFDSGRLQFQRSLDYPEAVIEAAGCNFWFQRLGGGIGIIPLFSEMPFLVLSEDFHVSRLGGGPNRKLYFWHTSQQIWQLSAIAALTPVRWARLKKTMAALNQPRSN